MQMPAEKIKLILDDRADLVEKLQFDGVHVDDGDLSLSRGPVGCLARNRIIGTFGGSDVLLPGILEGPADYLAIGPVFPTKTKQHIEAVD